MPASRLLTFFLIALLSGAPLLKAQNTELPLKAGDRISLSIGGILDSDAAQISKVYSISDTGTINLVHVGEVKAAGLKPSALQRAIQRAYVEGQFYLSPVVNVTIDGGQTPDRMVYVVSGCKKNGPVPYSAGMSIMKAVSVSGGFSDFAKPSKTKLIREGKSIPLDLSRITSHPERDIKLQPEDQIIVPE